MRTNTSSIKAYFVSERDDVNEIRLCYSNDRKYVDLQSGTYAIVDIQKTQKVNVYQKLSPLTSFFSIGGYPLLGNFNASPGGFYEIRYCKKGLFWKAVVSEVGPF